MYLHFSTSLDSLSSSLLRVFSSIDKLIGIHDPPRPGVARAVADLQQSHVAVVMITGDALVTASTIGAQLGIYDEAKHTALSGSQLDGMTAAELDRGSLNRLKRSVAHCMT